MLNTLPKLRPSPMAFRLADVPQSLKDFAAWYFEGGIKLKPPMHGLLFQQRKDTSVTSVVLYRDGNHQVELIILGPGSLVPRHRHDHVNSIEVMVSGSFDLYVGGVQCAMDRDARENGMSRDVLKAVPICSDAMHSGQASGIGGCFISVQEWGGMEPSHVGVEWQDDHGKSFS